MAGNILDMPVEMMEKIFSFAPDNATQYNIALTCKPFQTIGKPTLWSSYDNIEFTSDRRAVAKKSLRPFLDVISNHDELARQVKHVTIGGLEGRAFDGKRKSRLPPDPSLREKDRIDQYGKLYSILMRLTNLKTLELIGDFGFLVTDWVLKSLNPDLADRWPFPNLAHLREFHIDTPGSFHGVELLLSHTKAESMSMKSGDFAATAIGWNCRVKNTTVRHLELNGHGVCLQTLDDCLANCTELESLVLDEAVRLLSERIENPRAMGMEDF